MCYLRPVKVVRVKGRTVFLDNGIKALYNKKVGRLKHDDKVLVYGNLVIKKYDKKNKN
jgi:hypothetical protein